MNNASDFSVSFTVGKSPAEAFRAINQVSGWWSEEVEGETDREGAVWHYHFQDVHRCTMEITEMVPDKKVVWRVLDNYFKFTEDQSEWIGDTIVFEIAQSDGKTEVTFTQHGLTPANECYEICEGAWTNYLTDSLRLFIETGKGRPNATGKPRTEYEEQVMKD
ncbi:activator of HSP90 ATPase [Dyadobacter beijingensis]|uniref:Activator of HSP90 ATPase n=1 Tax=Dyadobacter beijingensis TaxID=365489 RepID=A0ABQ2I376_9BACT|nr:SRPBCC domain-containing protein [Dyadobacter beijingensis]GGM96372.1 activator of HSP90 ATPase [Dyadobacter beijingensis]